MASGAAAGGPGLNLFPHQQFVVNWLVQNRRSSLLLAHGMGTGKTRTAIAAMVAANQPFVLVAPLAVHKQWEREIAFQECEELCYKPILNARGLYSIFEESKVEMRKELFDFLRQGAALILDEAHVFKNLEFPVPMSKGEKVMFGEFEAWSKAKMQKIFIKAPEFSQSKTFVPPMVQAVCELADRACRVVALTGTPFVNKPSDFSIFFRICLNQPLVKQLFYFTEAQFNSLFVRPADGITRFQNLACNMVSVFNVSPEEKRANYLWPYQILNTIEYINASADDIAKIKEKPGMFLALMRTRTVAGKAIAPEFMAAMESIKGKRVAIYSNFIEKGIELVRPFLQDIPFSAITGATKDTDEEQRKYNSGETNVILLSPAAQEGVDLKNTEMLIIMDLNWSKAQQDQIYARVFRNNSHVSKTYPFNREIIEASNCGNGWLLLTTFPDPITGKRTRMRYRANAIPSDQSFEFVQFVRDQTVIVKTLLLTTGAAASGAAGAAAGSDVSMINLQVRKEENIVPYTEALQRASIELKQVCKPSGVMPPKTDIYQDAYPSGQDASSPCFDLNCQITPTVADGNCFFDAVRIALNNQVSLSELRNLVSEAMTDDMWQLWKGFATQPKTANDFKEFKDVSSLAEAQSIVQRTSWYANEWAMTVVAVRFELLFFVVKPGALTSMGKVQLVPFEADYQYKAVIPLWYEREHYKNIKCNGKLLYSIHEVMPQPIRDALMFMNESQHYSRTGKSYTLRSRVWSSPSESDPLPSLLKIVMERRNGQRIVMKPEDF